MADGCGSSRHWYLYAMHKLPLDKKWYEQDPRSQKIHAGLADGCYVYVQDIDGTVLVLPDAQHGHVRVLGERKPALYAGDVTIENGRIKDLTNLSGTFQFDDPNGLLEVARAVMSMGIPIDAGAVRLFSHIDSAPPRVLE